LKKRLELVRQQVQKACQRCGRQPSAVTLVGVTKGVPPEIINEAIALGLTDLGENRVQEARAKQLVLGSRFKASGTCLEPPASSLQPVRWHLIGHLQRNKAKYAVELFDIIHSVDSRGLIEELDRHATRRAQAMETLIQVNVSGEATKSGCRPEETETLASAIRQSTHLSLTGLMAIAPFSDNPESVRPVFQQLRRVRDELASALSLHPAALSLSMGMSQDFEVAIEEGADIVRIGTAIFGKRD
jgi:pyridoxal phosphate enzyme (YggS family)